MGSNRKRSEGLDDSFDNEFDDIEIVNLCEWLDRLPLSVNQRSEGDKRSQRKVSKDFADGVLLAELLKHYFPKLVDLHNYTPANATQQRMENWYLLNRKVLNKLGVDLSKQDIRTVSKDSNNLIHRVLMKVREQIDRHLQHPQGRNRKKVDTNDPEQGQQKDESSSAEKQSTPNKESSKNAPNDSLKPFSNKQQSQQKHESSSAGKQSTPNKESSKNAPNDSQALVPVKGFRSSNALVPAKQFQNPPPKAVSPRRYGRGEIPHSHPDRSLTEVPAVTNWDQNVDLNMQRASTYNFEKRLAMDSRVFYLPPIDSVPRQYLEEKEAECIAKDDTIRMLTSKMRSLEYQLQLKDTRLTTLGRQIHSDYNDYYYITPRKYKYPYRFR